MFSDVRVGQISGSITLGNCSSDQNNVCLLAIACYTKASSVWMCPMDEFTYQGMLCLMNMCFLFQNFIQMLVLFSVHKFFCSLLPFLNSSSINHPGATFDHMSNTLPNTPGISETNGENSIECDNILQHEIISDAGLGDGTASKEDLPASLGNVSPVPFAPALGSADGSLSGAAAVPNNEPGDATPPVSGSFSAPTSTNQVNAPFVAEPNVDGSGSSAVAPVQEQQIARPVTRLQRGIRKPKTYTDGIIRYGCLIVSGEPEHLQEALEDKNWKGAMDSEFDALMRNKTWHLVPPNSGRNLIDCKWVYKIKKKSDGTRLVAKGFKQ